MKLLAWLMGRRSVEEADLSSGIETAFSRAGGEVVPFREDGMRSPNSGRAEVLRSFLQSRLWTGVSLKELALRQGRDPKRFYCEAEGAAVLSFDFIDERVEGLTLEDRLRVGNFVVGRWGLTCTPVKVPPLEG